MSTALHLARPGDLDRLSALVAACHTETGIDQDEAARKSALLPLLEGVPQGAVWLIGPRSAPLGYVAVGLGWSIELGGADAFVDEFYIRPSVRGRGLGSEALSALARALRGEGVKALHLEVAWTNTRAKALYERLGFESRERYHLMTCRL